MKTIYRFFEFGAQSKGNEQGDDVTILAKGTRFLPEPAIASYFLSLSIVPDNLQFFTVIQGKQDFTFWKAKVSKLWPSVNITGASRIIVGILSMQDEGQRG